jgi:predicted RNA-binding Zn-ribbon protein involved in translation (DUF1610 family)
VAIPERLVTIRAYDSPQLAEGDLALLAAAGINGYVSSSFIRHRMRSELRVPESDAQTALELLPPQLPTVSEQLNRVRARCPQCGGAGVHVTSPATQVVLIIGAALAVWALLRGQVNAAVVTMFAALAIAVPVRALTRHYQCQACGHRWRRGDPDVRMFPGGRRREGPDDDPESPTD